MENCATCQENSPARLVEVPGKYRLLSINRNKFSIDRRKVKTKVQLTGMEVVSFIMHRG